MSATAPEMRISGIVVAGVEAGCLLLSPAEGQDWLLLGDTTGLEPGQTVTVEGRADPRAVSTCQQGRPFRVGRIV